MKTVASISEKAAALRPPAGDPGPVNEKWASHYRVLLALRARLEAERQIRRFEASAPIEPHSTHPADSATDEFDHDLAFTLLAHEEDALREVTEAIERIRQGTYGVCLASGKPISAQRLKVLPWCRYSREVEETLESEGRRPKLHLPEVHSVRGTAATIPGTGDIGREGSEHEAKQPEEPKARKQIDEAASPGDSDERDDQ
jgi:RNA polymerase-binding transcription factor DksA